MPYMFGVPADLSVDGPAGKPRQPVVKRADNLLHYAKVRDQWERRSSGDGSKGERLYDWTFFAVQVKDESPADGFTHWLVLRRSLHPNRRGKDGQLEDGAGDLQAAGLRLSRQAGTRSAFTQVVARSTASPIRSRTFSLSRVFVSRSSAAPRAGVARRGPRRPCRSGPPP
ncbi:hypothetical protein BIV23_04960 [Streptomyces monashensis]|uniref:Uncharacterized protein n=1 Tax=Streptomyces monashensis TaxID=1678012 RepID=A0A1S2QL70_9ACTN|nr:hypothetical protein BIV23_04960 [Streptomyces monashensis]